MTEQRFSIRDRQQRKKFVEIIHADDHLLLVNKPAGIPVIPDRFQQSPTHLLAALQGHLRRSTGDEEANLWVVHRLDQDTSGIMLFARSAEAHRRLNEMFQEQEIKKTYLAVVAGAPAEPSGTIDRPLRRHPSRKVQMQVHRNGKASLTRYQLLESYRRFSLLALFPESGRTHQIRVHLSSINLPLAVDPLYGTTDQLSIADIKPRMRRRLTDGPAPSLISRIPLHAYRLAFSHPLTGEPVDFTAPLPKELNALINALRKYDADGKNFPTIDEILVLLQD